MKLNCLVNVTGAVSMLEFTGTTAQRVTWSQIAPVSPSVLTMGDAK